MNMFVLSGTEDCAEPTPQGQRSDFLILKFANPACDPELKLRSKATRGDL